MGHSKKLFFNTRSFGVGAYNSFKPKIKACNINFVSKDHLNRRILTQLSGIFFLIKLMISGKKVFISQLLIYKLKK